MNFFTVLGEYVDTAIWLSHCNGTATSAHSDPADCRGEDCDKGLDDLGFTGDDLSAAAARDMEADLKGFIDSCLEERPDVFDGLTNECIGSNFYLTRNGHGVGFWDLGLGDRGDYLTQLSKPFGESHLYVNNNGELEAE